MIWKDKFLIRADDQCDPMVTKREDKVGSRGRYQYIKAAEQLGYGKDVVKKIEKAKTEIEINNILAAARHGD